MTLWSPSGPLEIPNRQHMHGCEAAEAYMESASITKLNDLVLRTDIQYTGSWIEYGLR